MGMPGLGDKFTQVRPSCSQRIDSHASKLTLCTVLRSSLSAATMRREEQVTQGERWRKR
jgi:hypothetical protein